MRVDIFITTDFAGNFASCAGAYGIMLQVMKDGRPVTKEHYAGWSGISYQKLNVRAAVEAIQYVTVPCDVVIHIDNAYVQGVAESQKTQGKYKELWLQFFAACNRMKSVRVERESKHEYTRYLKKEIARERFTVVKDK